jgi:hypothetical protein
VGARNVIKQIRIYLGLITLVVGLLSLIGLVVWASWATAPLLAFLLIAWTVLIAVGVGFGRARHTREDWRPGPGQEDRRRLEAMALELRRLKPDSHLASMVLDHKPAYERRVSASEDVQ